MLKPLNMQALLADVIIVQIHSTDYKIWPHRHMYNIYLYHTTNTLGCFQKHVSKEGNSARTTTMRIISRLIVAHAVINTVRFLA